MTAPYDHQLDALAEAYARRQAVHNRRVWDASASGVAPATSPMFATPRRTGAPPSGAQQVWVGQTITVTSPGVTDGTVEWDTILPIPRAAGFDTTVPTETIKSNVQAYYQWIVRGVADGAATLTFMMGDPDEGPLEIDSIPVAGGPFHMVVSTGLIRADCEHWIEVDGTVT